MYEPNSNRSLSLDVERVSSKKTDLEVGVEWVKRFCQGLGERKQELEISAADAKYGNLGFND